MLMLNIVIHSTILYSKYVINFSLTLNSITALLVHLGIMSRLVTLQISPLTYMTMKSSIFIMNLSSVNNQNVSNYYFAIDI